MSDQPATTCDVILCDNEAGPIGTCTACQIRISKGDQETLENLLPTRGVLACNELESCGWNLLDAARTVKTILRVKPETTFTELIELAQKSRSELRQLRSQEQPGATAAPPAVPAQSTPAAPSTVEGEATDKEIHMAKKAGQCLVPGCIAKDATRGICANCNYHAKHNPTSERGKAAIAAMLPSKFPNRPGTIIPAKAAAQRKADKMVRQDIREPDVQSPIGNCKSHIPPAPAIPLDACDTTEHLADIIEIITHRLGIVGVGRILGQDGSLLVSYRDNVCRYHNGKIESGRIAWGVEAQPS